VPRPHFLWSATTALSALGAVAIVVREDGWRTAVAAGVAAACVLATRVRFAPLAGVVLLAIVAGLALDGRMPANDDRAAAAHGAHRPRHHARPAAAHGAHRPRHHARPAAGRHRREG
jgi:hypothetical protein